MSFEFQMISKSITSSKYCSIVSDSDNGGMTISKMLEIAFFDSYNFLLAAYHPKLLILIVFLYFLFFCSVFFSFIFYSILFSSQTLEIFVTFSSTLQRLKVFVLSISSFYFVRFFGYFFFHFFDLFISVCSSFALFFSSFFDPFQFLFLFELFTSFISSYFFANFLFFEVFFFFFAFLS